ncbi:10 TM acyl transferase domain found in Cas1p-domain-containing protein [Xylariales sp. AK1849]|nr:10 TM acyl transferase domain found in Cas1p-domain-containing protein [Xylariales sp. AK1849]
MPRTLREPPFVLDQWTTSSLLNITTNAVIIVTLLLVTFQGFASVGTSKHDCLALFNNGNWPLSHSKSDDIERPFEKWEPTGCRMREFSRDNFHDCLGGRRVVFAGDSTIRQIYWAAATRLDHERAHVAVLDVFVENTKHRDIFFEANGVKLEFIWDPWLNSSRLATELARFQTQETFVDVGIVKSKDEESAALLILGSPGLWAARHGADDYLNIFKRGIDDIKTHLNSSLDDTLIAPTVDTRRNYDLAPNQILLAPVQVPWYDSLSPGRADTITPERVDKMNGYLADFSPDERSHVMWTYNRMTEGNWKAFEETGIHVVDRVAERKIDVALNARCNAPVGARYPHKQTCCMMYPHTNLLHLALFPLAVFGFPLLMLINGSTKFTRRSLPSNETLSSIRYVLFTLAWCRMTDRSHDFVKVNRHYHQDDFLACCVAFFLVSSLSYQTTVNPTDMTTSPRGRRRNSNPMRQSDPGFLSRDQSDEWKGWMQVLILIYHYNHASQMLWVYKLIRLMVSAYVFLSGYGHTAYLLRTRDFSLRRVAAVLLRLNFLSALLPYVMSTDYNFYYFAPVITFWYLVVWLTLRTFRAHNQDPLLLFAKILIAATITSCFILIPGPLESLSTLCRGIFRMSWDSREARFRLSLDRYIVFFGMMTASTVHRLALIQDRHILPEWSYPTSPQAHRPSLVDPALSVIVFPDALTKLVKPVAYMFFSLFALIFFIVSQAVIDDKEQYNMAHAYMSWIPILSFVILRNSHRALRNSYLALPAALGKISLETYVLQYHMWLGGDATAKLRLGIWARYGGPDVLAGLGGLLDTVLITVTFICFSAQVRHATETLTKWLFGSKPGARRRRPSVHHPEVPSKERSSGDRLERPMLSPDNPDERNLLRAGRIESSWVGSANQAVVGAARVRAVSVILVLWMCNWVSA